MNTNSNCIEQVSFRWPNFLANFEYKMCMYIQRVHVINYECVSLYTCMCMNTIFLYMHKGKL